jgi:hypothetical protein
MQEIRTVLTVLGILAIVIIAQAGGFNAYPGAKLDERATSDANDLSRKSGLTSRVTVYTTNDPFEKVAAFYKGIAKEYVMPGMSKKGPQLAFFLFDNGKDLATSKLWAKVQRPAMGLYQQDVKENKTRDLTVIMLVDKR